jgi:dihydrofolate reductase
MGKIIITEHISIDNVIQSPGDINEDTSGNFTYGGWISGYSNTELDDFFKKIMKKDNDFLFGRKTFDIWEPYWPENYDVWPEVNTARKYVVSKTKTNSNWKNTTFINDDILFELRKLKTKNDKDLVVWGSSVLVDTIINYELVDEIVLIQYPIILGCGKRIFLNNQKLTKFSNTLSMATSTGVICSIYSK